MRRDPAALYWWGAMAVAIASFFGGIATVIINAEQERPSDTWSYIGWGAFAFGITLALIAGLGLIHVGVENMGWKPQWPFRWPLHREQPRPQQPASGTYQVRSKEDLEYLAKTVFAAVAQGGGRGGDGGEGGKGGDSYGGDAGQGGDGGGGGGGFHAGHGGKGGDGGQALPVTNAPRSEFDPRTIVTEIQRVNLDGLQGAESYALVTFTVRNFSGYPVEITGVNGRLTCSGQICTGPISVERAPIKVPPSSFERHTCEITQPLGDGMMQHIVGSRHILGEGTLYWQVGLSWSGTVELPEGNVPLRDCHFGVADFIVRGPISHEGASNLFKVPVTFASSDEYDGDGWPKPRPAE